jgi:myo-inositol-1(or 4)-monophosphatase
MRHPHFKGEGLRKLVEQHSTGVDLNFLKSLLVEGGKLALSRRGQIKASLKADLTPVTEVDHQVEDYLVERIRAQYPQHRILSEESGVLASGDEFAWIIDPIDGTRSFAAGLPIWGVSIGVLRHSQPFVGGFYLPVTREMYWGTCQEAFYNEQRLNPQTTVDLDNPLSFLAVPSDFHLRYTTTYPRARSMGSTAAHLAYVATGAAVGALLEAFSLWDLAGMLPALAALGITTTTLTGSAFQPGDLQDGHKASQPILVAHPQAAAYLRTSIRGISTPQKSK